MMGAIAGDVIGSAHEGGAPQEKNFPLFVSRSTFTDDTVLTVAIASAITQGKDYGSAIRQWGRRYPHAGYRGWFQSWLFGDDARPYNSFGNGSAMRVSAIGWAFDDYDLVVNEAGKSAEVTHNHPEGIKGAQAVAAAVLFARTGKSNKFVRCFRKASATRAASVSVNSGAEGASMSPAREPFLRLRPRFLSRRISRMLCATLSP